MIRYKAYGIEFDEQIYLGEADRMEDAIEIAKYADKHGSYDQVIVEATRIIFHRMELDVEIDAAFNRLFDWRKV